MTGSVGGLIAVAMAFALNAVSPSPALAWGDEGHEIIALIAQAYLDPSVGKAASDLLAADTGSLTTHDIAGEAIWADRIRDYQSGRERTAHWHYVDIEIGAPNVDRACFNHPALPPGVWASRGPGLHHRQDRAVRGRTRPARYAGAGAFVGFEVPPPFRR